jgi:hypothetical protein
MESFAKRNNEKKEVILFHRSSFDRRNIFLYFSAQFFSKKPDKL